MAAPRIVFNLVSVVKTELKAIRLIRNASMTPSQSYSSMTDDISRTLAAGRAKCSSPIHGKINEVECNVTSRVIMLDRIVNNALRRCDVMPSPGGPNFSLSHKSTCTPLVLLSPDVILSILESQNRLALRRQILQPAYYWNHVSRCSMSSVARRNYCSVSRTCWNCHALTTVAHKSEVQFFCDSCHAIQPVNPDSNFFQIMLCDQTFDIDTEQLTQTFRNLQRQLHPDKFSIMSKEEQDYSAMQSSEVNKAYSTLLKPLSRGLYLLELNGLTIEEGDAGIEPGFLMEVMETNEELAETDDDATVRRIGEENTVKLGAFLKDLSQAFSEGNYPQAREILMRLKYFSNIDDKVKDKLEKSF
ncbi:iron-sulfur cluster co-chaperone protein HscB, mitochondrial-like [Acanthaster planci]|uniref:Iron-sulfur cluster co-chaperone protein HscB, mitochondrial-like n=1 Tax=Acanthaster planci TaxID=133434 RepID=A0A8B7YT10_ACAPL|nr:iron-sulfur cluster co-chaperone protein HscB, mitochondrial-like [Acanthaster planci]